ncbi:MAG: FAD-dependent monooxygenase [SAR86 cluster bacterium]|nr:FAD-dependent monooxygenase [SAR86 cluster bacterium]
MNHDYDIAIIGLGPVGSFAALLLEKKGLKVIAIDKEKDIYSLPRAVSISDQGLRMTQEVEIDDIYIKHSTEVGGAGFVDKELKFIGEPIDLKGFTTPNGWPPMRFFHQPYTDKEIRKKLDETSVTILLEHEMMSVEDNDEGIKFITRNLIDSNEQEYSCKYLIGADGGSSAVRKLLKITQEDLDYNRDWVVVDVELTGKNRLDDKAIQICDSERIGTFIPSHLPFRRWEFIIYEDEDKNDFENDKKIQELIGRWLEPDEYKIIRKAVYQFHSVLADNFRKGNCFLIGDAAHQNPPFMGEGMMSGYRDAFNLAWKISYVISNNFSPILLDSYQEERRPHANFVVENSAGIGELMEAYANANDPEDVPEELVAKGYGSFILPNLDEGLFFGGKALDSMAAGQIFPQIVLYKDGVIEERKDHLLGNGFSFISKNKIKILDHHKEFLDQLNCKFITVEADVLESNPWVSGFLELGDTFVIRPDKYIYGCSSNNVSLEEIIDDLKARMIRN